MTLQELKDKKILPQNLKDNEIIKICNEVLGTDEVKSMDYNLEENLIDKVRFSKQMMNIVIEKILSSQTKSRSRMCEEALAYLNAVKKIVDKKDGFTDETKHIGGMITKITADKQLADTLDQMYVSQKDKIASVDPNNLKKLNKEALAVMMSSMLGNQDQMMAFMQSMVEELKEVKKMVEGMEKRSSHSTTTQDPDFEVPEGPKLITAEELEQQRQETRREMQPLIKPNSIHDLRNKNIIPKGINDKEIIEYCNTVLKFQPSIVDIETSLSEKQVETLRNSNLIANNGLRQEITENHKIVVNDYETLINNYRNMLEGIKGNPDFEEEETRITELIGKLESQQAAYQTTINGFDIQDMEQYFNFGPNASKLAQAISDYSRNQASNNQEKLTEIDEELASLEARKDRLESVQTQFFFNKLKNNFQVKHLSSRIEKLRKKQGKIQTKQKRIISSNTTKYVQRMEKEFRKYMKEQEKLSMSVQAKQDKIDALNEKQDRIDRLNRKIVSLDEKRREASQFRQSMIDRKKTRLETKRERIENAKKRLQDKVGRVNLSEQFQRTFERDYAFAM